MTPLDRVALADALASASAETLRGYAKYLSQAEERIDASGPLLVTDTREELYGLRQCYRTLAALALACAELSEAPTGVQITTDHTEELVASVQVWGEADICAPTLPAALAALLKGDQ